MKVTMRILICIVTLLTGCMSHFDEGSIETSHSLVRNATEFHLDQIENLAEQRRVAYAKAQPMYFRQADGAREKHLLYLRDQLKLGKQIMLVHQTYGRVDGFLMANLVTPPPIYDPGGKTLMIDDFVVANPKRWAVVGGAMLSEAERRAKEQGAVQVVAVCGDADAAKEAFLKSRGLSVASSWFTRPIN